MLGYGKAGKRVEIEIDIRVQVDTLLSPSRGSCMLLHCIIRRVHCVPHNPVP